MTSQTSQTSQTGLVHVELRRFPLRLFLESQQHHEELFREFALLEIERAEGLEPHAPARLLRLIDDLQKRYAGIGAATDEVRDSAIARGEAEVDLAYEVPADIAEACKQLNHALDSADEYCREGAYLLTLAPTPAMVAFRRWYLGEFVRQIEGAEPTPWPDSQYARDAGRSA